MELHYFYLCQNYEVTILVVVVGVIASNIWWYLVTLEYYQVMILFLISDIFLDDFINVKSQWREMLLSDMRSRQTKWLATVVKWLQQCQRRDNWCWASPRSLPLHFSELSSGSGESQQEKEASHSSQLVNNIRSDWGQEELSLSLSLSLSLLITSYQVSQSAPFLTEFLYDSASLLSLDLIK